MNFRNIAILWFLATVILTPELAHANVLPIPEPMGWDIVNKMGDWLSTVEAYGFKAIKILILTASVAGFIWCAYSGLTKFNECRNARAEWSELGVIVAFIAGLMVLNTLLLTASHDVVETQTAQANHNTTIRTSLLPRAWWGEKTNYAYDLDGNVIWYPDGIDPQYVDDNGVYHAPQEKK